MTSIVLEWHNDVAERLVQDKLKWLHAKAEEIKGLAQTMCPVDTGALKGSAYVQEIEDVGLVPMASVTDLLARAQRGEKFYGEVQ